MALSLSQAKHLRHGQTVYEIGAFNADGSARRWRVSGKVKTWKTMPDRVHVPIKHGLYDSYFIEEFNLRNFTLTEPSARKKTSRRR